MSEVTGSSSACITVPFQPETVSPWDNKLFALREFRAYTQHLMGRLKTMVDAAVPEARQNKAIKDVLHELLWKEHYEEIKAWAERQTYASDKVQFDPCPFTTSSLPEGQAPYPLDTYNG